ncbi:MULTISPECIES: GNAT family N-acetyltransferase [Bacillaceae]|uniref:GNAT family N-acetyltransferase n=1 Tax=Bacillaceae TaxID=186817 RepID=UPI001E28ABCF|nr:MULTISPECIES: GNAT family N-acetyltransferase [Bacillaceae]MCE4048080.1 GNAT family N-acetyltransferase [Bacillus sp. Au-Bac7]MCM3032658.1 GNAT family N-acetyltransferase [Niallia sp. MER 6]MDL0434395.1 GNAT family N-acetyltransferase [Niallia sp. SS-2023]UPO89139.1 GNAT family N-acetyltransferase [Niallia sp. Man26]
MSYLFTSERLGFRFLTDEDLKACESFWGSEEVMAYTGGSIEAALLPQVIHFYEQTHQDFGVSVYAVEELATGRIIGAAGFDLEAKSEDIELIFHFIKDVWGQGYGAEAAVACIQYAAEVYEPKSIIAKASVENRHALNVLGRIGFSYLGINYSEDIEQDEALFQLVL